MQIAAPPFLVQLFFKDPDGTGWSEGYWWNASGYQAALDDWDIEALGSLAVLRLALIPDSGASLIYIRVSDTTKKRDTLVKGYSVEDGKGTYPPDVGDQLPADDAVLMRHQAFNGDVPVFALRELRAIPEECCKDGEYDPKPAWVTNLTTFNNALKTKGKVVVKVDGEPQAFDIDSITALHMSQRKTGRPFGLSAGRSKRP